MSSVLLLMLAGCKEPIAPASVSQISQQELEIFMAEIKARQVFVQGGDFLMGDFGSSHGEEGVQLDFNSDSKPLHEVSLSGYYIDRYKVTNRDFEFYLKHQGKTRRTDVSSRYLLFMTQSRLPAHMDWYEAESYCAWLSEISGLPFSLATEAQWEYAARNRGQFSMVSTDDGRYRYEASVDGDLIGVNISASFDRIKFAEELGWDTGGTTPLPVDRYPPNALGIYSMSDNGREWVKDWYDADYYKNSPKKDPQGPEQPVHKDMFGRHTKVMRGQSSANEYWPVGVNVHRFPVDLGGYALSSKLASITGSTARCVINKQGALN